ncbi:hypothetical protein AAGT10_15010 (plasmid) [Sulfolobus tengchongensis]|uniref:MarR family transcriptional regulator n=1 Tax=Sulfolobus tengchongensis TaxID=207809 RepID=A0AAX4L4Y1_9CREN
MSDKQEVSIFLDTPAKLLVALFELGGRANIRKLAEKLSKEYGTSFTSVYNTLYLLEKEGFLTIRREGRERIIELTDRGKTIAGKLAILMSELIETLAF